MSALVDISLEIFKLAEKKIHIETFLEEFLCLVKKALNAEQCQINIYDRETKSISNSFCCKSGMKIIKKNYQPHSGTDILIDIFHRHSDRRQLANITKKILQPTESKKIDELISTRVKSLLVVPMINREKVIGYLFAVNKKDKSKFSKSDEKLISVFASQSALVIKNFRLFEENLTKDRLSNLGKRIIDSAHGLKNILNNLDGGTFIVERGTLTKNMQEVNKGWDILKRNSNRLRDLVLDILFYSRPKKPEYKLTDINIICLDVSELIDQIAKEHNIKIELDLNPSIGLFCLDPKGIYRCILNLVSNAINACQEKGSGEVSIKTSIDANQKLEIVVADTGTGISKENLDHIFDVFFSTKGSTGTGLGLAVTKKIINEHLGKITVASEVGNGSIFTITLPKNTSSECFQKNN